MLPTETVLEFVDAVNHQHIDKMIGMMTPDHLFTDSLGNQIPGRRAMRDAWLAYFNMVSDYKILIKETFVKDRVVLAVGSAQGEYSTPCHGSDETNFEISGVWRAVVERDRIREWRVFADNKPLRDLILSHEEDSADNGGSA